jgi:hypothetical protein
MSERGRVLELLHTADVRWETLRAVGREWRRPEAHIRAFLRDRPEKLARLRRERAPVPPEVEERWRLWMAHPDKVRAEFPTGDGDVVTAVIVGATWWSWSPNQGVRTNAGRENSSHGVGPGEPLVRPAAILPALDLEVRGATSAVGREAFVVKARPARVDEDLLHSNLHGIGPGADEYEFLVDAERGVLLRAEARMEGHAFRILEMEEVAFDEAFPTATFRSPQGEEVEVVEPTRMVPLSELPGVVPFTVLVPEHPPGRCEYAEINPPERRWSRPLSATLSYEGMGWAGEGEFGLFLEEAGGPLPGPRVEWEDAEGVRIAEDPRGERVWSSAGPNGYTWTKGRGRVDVTRYLPVFPSYSLASRWSSEGE